MTEESRTQPSLDEYVDGVLGGDRAMLARAITLVESSAPAHAPLAARLLERVLPHSGGALRVGITGAPGVGKSCLIERLGGHLTGRGRRVAVGSRNIFSSESPNSSPRKFKNPLRRRAFRLK